MTSAQSTDRNVLYVQHLLSTQQYVHRINSLHSNLLTASQARTLIDNDLYATLAEATLRMTVKLCIYMHVL